MTQLHNLRLLIYYFTLTKGKKTKQNKTTRSFNIIIPLLLQNYILCKYPSNSKSL